MNKKKLAFLSKTFIFLVVFLPFFTAVFLGSKGTVVCPPSLRTVLTRSIVACWRQGREGTEENLLGE